MKKLSQLWKILTNNKKYVFFFIIFVTGYITLFGYFRQQEITQEDIRTLVEPFGIWGPLVLFATQLVFSLTPMPDAAMPMVAYILYGIPGVLIVMTGMFLVALFHYYLGQKLGKNFFTTKFPLIKKNLEKLNNGNTVIKLVYLRIFTLVSYDITSYIAGISNIPKRTFIVALILGLIPANIALVVISSGLFSNSPQETLLVWVIVLAVVSGLAYLYKHSTIK